MITLHSDHCPATNSSHTHRDLDTIFYYYLLILLIPNLSICCSGDVSFELVGQELRLTASILELGLIEGKSGLK